MILLLKRESDSIVTFPAIFFEYYVVMIRVNILTDNPNKITIPRSASSIPAAPTGPGVGGTIVWVQNNPMDKAIAVPASDKPACLERDLLRGDKIINPLSQKTGMETI